MGLLYIRFIFKATKYAKYFQRKQIFLVSCVKIKNRYIEWSEGMNGQERRNAIIEYIKKSETPVSGTKLAEIFSVSRQVIVQDVALIRAGGYDITSTNRGYVLKESATVGRIFYVNHTDDELEAELCAVVDMGGKVVNVMVEHDVYGKMEADLNVASRLHVKTFMDDIRSGQSSPLKNITSDDHAHYIEAESEEILDLIEKKFSEMNILRSV